MSTSLGLDDEPLRSIVLWAYVIRKPGHTLSHYFERRRATLRMADSTIGHIC